MDKNNILDMAAKAAQQQRGGPAPQPSVTAQPSPMSVQIGQTKDQHGNSYVVLIINHLYGQNVFHFDPDGIDRIADALKEAARVARTGLEIPRLK